MKKTFKDWFFATRPWSFVVSATPVLATIAYLLWKGYGPDIDWINAALALVGIVLFHAAGNVLSDYFDHRNGIDTKDAYCVQDLVNGRFKPIDYLKLSCWLFAFGCLVGLILTLRSDWRLLCIGGAGLIITLLYSRLKFVALGDSDIFLNFGLLPMLGTSLCTTGAIVWDSLLLSLPIGLITVSVLHANNTRDIASDQKAGATSFAGLIGPKASMWTYIAFICLPLAYTVVAALLGWFPYWTLLSIAALPVVVGNVRQALKAKTEGTPAFNQLDLMSAKLQMVFGLLLILGFVVAWIL